MLLRSVQFFSSRPGRTQASRNVRSQFNPSRLDMNIASDTPLVGVRRDALSLGLEPLGKREEQVLGPGARQRGVRVKVLEWHAVRIAIGDAFAPIEKIGRVRTLNRADVIRKDAAIAGVAARTGIPEGEVQRVERAFWSSRALCAFFASGCPSAEAKANKPAGVAPSCQFFAGLP